MKKQLFVSPAMLGLPALLFVLALALNACQKEDVPENLPSTIGEADSFLIKERAINDPTIVDPPVGFGFALRVSTCYGGGSTVRVDIPQPQRYTFRWVLDGRLTSTGISTSSCICAHLVKVYVVRNADGYTMSKEIRLQGCDETTN